MPSPLCQMASELSRHILWSDEVMYRSLSQLPHEELVRERPSLFRNMLHTMNHIVVINHIWQHHLLGQKHSYVARNTPEHPPLDALREQHLALDRWYVDWFEAQSEAALQTPVDFELIGGQNGRMTRLQILQHMAMHTHYHRGYVADMFYQIEGQRPPTMDLPVFYREHPSPGGR